MQERWVCVDSISFLFSLLFSFFRLFVEADVVRQVAAVTER